MGGGAKRCSERMSLHGHARPLFPLQRSTERSTLSRRHGWVCLGINGEAHASHDAAPASVARLLAAASPAPIRDPREDPVTPPLGRERRRHASRPEICRGLYRNNALNLATRERFHGDCYLHLADVLAAQSHGHLSPTSAWLRGRNCSLFGPIAHSNYGCDHHSSQEAALPDRRLALVSRVSFANPWSYPRRTSGARRPLYVSAP